MTILVIITAILVTTIIGTGITPIPLQLQQSAYAWTDPNPQPRSEKAPIATSGNNIYTVWFSDKTPGKDGEVFFRASNDNGATFGPKINLSNTTGVDSINAEIDTAGDRVYVSWWERANATSNVPVLKISTDNGKTFGPILKLAANGTIGASSGGGE
jgi:hypothetical protein